MKKQQDNTCPLALRQITTRRGDFDLRVRDFKLERGQIACIVGPNGGGKTTFLLTTLGLLPHDGECLVQGQPYDGTQPELKGQIGFIPDDPDLLFETLTAREQWGVTASVLARVRPDLTVADLDARAAQLAHALAFDAPATVAQTYSHGMRKKTQIVNALLGYPPILVIDELRNGLDPIAIKQTEDLIRSERDRGAAILVATHDLWWAERFADVIYVLNHGRIVAAGTLKQLLRRREQGLEEAFFRIVGANA